MCPTRPARRVVVIGNGMVGAKFVDEVITRGASALEITVLGDEHSAAYNRALLTDVIAGRAAVDALSLGAGAGPAAVTVRTGTSAVWVDRDERVVETAGGDRYRYDLLVLATGSHPVVPRLAGWSGIDLPAGVHTFRTIDDCREIVAAARPEVRAVVLGGGALGVETARALLSRGARVVLVHRRTHLLSRHLDATAGTLVSMRLRTLGVDVRLQAEASAVDVVDARIHALVLDDGERLPCDLLVLACGVRPAGQLVPELTGVTGGVVVDDRLHAVMDPFVAAIGDCAEHDGVAAGLVAPGWEQAAVLADQLTAVGIAARFRGIRQLLRLKAADLEVAAVGSPADLAAARWQGHPTAQLFGRTGDDGSLVSAALVGGGVVAAAVVGAPQTAGDLLLLAERGFAPPAATTLLALQQAPNTNTNTNTSSADPTRMAHRTTICRCNGVTKGAIVSAWQAGARTVAAVARSTRATTGCGSCVRTTRGLLDSLDAADAERPAGDAAPDMALPTPASRTTNRRMPMRTDAKRLVVVGGGMVAHRMTEALLDRDPEGAWHVTVLAEEPRAPYDRVALTTYFAGRNPEDLALGDPQMWHDQRVTLRRGDKATAIDRAAKTVTAASGKVIPYDALVLATGSSPFVPPVEGNDLPGCFVYRTIDDVAELRAYVEDRKRQLRRPVAGAVVGGGLLGLEAAGALQALGVEGTVVEFAPRLMPLQVDDAGGEALRRLITGLGVKVRTATATTRIVKASNGRVRRMMFGNRDRIDVDVVVFATGVRPRDELARAAHLEIGPRGGVVVDDTCMTADPAVWAVGEVASIEGRCIGLVAPGYAMAEVVVDRLLGGGATFAEADMSAKLKLLGVDVASFGDAFGLSDGALSVVYADPVAGVYKKLVLSDDAKTLRGGILVGDASAYASLRAMVDRPLVADPSSYLLPEGGVPAAGDLPDDAAVCSCHNVSAATIRGAVRGVDGAPGCASLDEVKAGTKAGTGCGSCVPLVKRLVTTELEAAGVAVSRALCEHFELSRAQLFDVVRISGLRSFSDIVARHGRGRGCDICKPVVASVLASLGGGHVLEGEQATLQDTNDHVLANIQKDGTYSVVPRVPGGEITPEGLIAIGEVAREFGLYTKITGGQRIDLFGARIEQLPHVWARLIDAGFESGHAYGKAVRTVKSCVGSTWCRYGVQDSVGMAVALELRYRGLRSPHKLKLGVSGCARECAEARGKDVGVIATENGWNVYVGGNGGFTPRHAKLLAEDLDDAALLRTIDRFLMYYVRTADRLQRTAPWLEEIEGGLDHVRDVVLNDSLGIAADLDAAMAAHVAGYEDEWAATLQDPVKLQRFVSFVNAPEESDPSLAYVVERGQSRPATRAEQDAVGALSADGSSERSGSPVVIAGPRLQVVNR